MHVQMAIEKIIMCLPLEFRGSDPVRVRLPFSREIDEGRCIGLAQKYGNGRRIYDGQRGPRCQTYVCTHTPRLSSICPSTVIELVTPPDLNQARVNKCLIALVNRKIVHKDSASVSMVCSLHTCIDNGNDNRQGSVLYHWHGLS